MCGICGIVNFKATDAVNPDLLERMTSAQAHRGPDDHGYFVDGNAGLGHRRLSIIDLSGGSQPIFNEDRSIAVVFNGEIYNYAELTQNLVTQGHHFRTRSDTETIVHAYEQHGDDCVRDFRGMFAFAVWDRRRKRLLVARDRLGIKPLYYYRGTNFFAFASEIKSLLQHPNVPRDIDVHALDMYLALRYIPGSRTIFKNIFKLQPAHLLILDETGLHTRRYWDVDYSEATRLSDAACLEKFEALFEESIRLRLISEVPLGVFLSGGLDSTATLAMMSRITQHQRIKTFSVGYDISGASQKEAAESDELHFARQAAAHFNSEHHEFRLSAAQFRDAVPLMAYHLDEPMGDPTCIPLYFISKMARQTVTVVLSGEGADETLGGYPLYRRILMLDKIRSRLGPMARLALAGTNLPWSERVNSYISRIASPLEEHYRGVVKAIGAKTRSRLAGERRLMQCDERLREIFASHFSHVEHASVLNRMLYADLKVWLPENLLLKADKMTMATAVELRVPFLDHKLVEFTATLRDSLKIRDGHGKWILRRVMGNEIPPSILNRPKKGFTIPAAAWLRFEMRDFVRDTLLARNSACSSYFERQAISDVIERYSQGKFSGFQEVWSLIVFEEWYRQFMTGSAKSVELHLQAKYGDQRVA
jgi:asparagine synthase (glutamine-hydrolysing)